ncbi:unnamed protein product [Adineta ricciae]|uniref:Vesicle-fusing ATPase n=1 Tax=Adineta ricciae TaxID=249248 RepID=A0A813U205_ADIRI|nr:unnamed protein product [Adineta ricciae]
MTLNYMDAIEKGKQLAERATEADRQRDYETAAGLYMDASNYFMHAMKYGAMNDATKTTIRTKVDTYLKRAEEIRNKQPSKQAVAVSDAAQGNDGGVIDPDKKRTMQRLERQFHYVYLLDIGNNDFIEILESIVDNPQVSFANVVGLDQAKRALREAVILPIKLPKLFKGQRKPFIGILLYGPPGTGKSYLAKAIATECKSTFISVTSSNLLSRWLGDSEKAVTCLFELARERKPCVVFIDEVDALCGQRNENESESARRVKNEFLVQMDGVASDNSGVLFLGATNMPWELDQGMRRRFEKRIYIPLPGVNERAAMFKTHLGVNTYHTIKEHEWMQLAQRAEHYSGADIAVVCREALLRPIRRLSDATHFKQMPNPNVDPNEPTHLWFPCSPGDASAKSLTLDNIDPDEIGEPPVTMTDMLAAVETQKGTVCVEELKKYDAFTEKFGQGGS